MAMSGVWLRIRRAAAYRARRAHHHSSDRPGRGRRLVRSCRRRLLHLAGRSGGGGSGPRQVPRAGPDDRRVRRRNDRRHLSHLRDAADPARRSPGPDERGHCRDRPADAPPPRHPDPDDQPRHRGRRPARRRRERPHRVGVADLRAVRLRACDVAGEVDDSHPRGPVPARANGQRRDRPGKGSA
jgi:hypothetical protein